MDKNKKRFSRKKAKKGKSTKKTNAATGYKPVFRTMPVNFNVQLRTRTYDILAAATGITWFKYGAIEPFGQNCLYITQLFDLYRRARIVGSRIHITVINTGNEPVEAVLVMLPHNWTSGSPTLGEAIDKPGSKRLLISGAGGMDRASIENGRSSTAALGGKFQLADFDFDFSQASSGTPIQADEPTWIMGVSALNSSSAVSVRLEVVIQRDFTFFDQTAV